MWRKVQSGLVLASVLAWSGCATTGGNTRTEIDALNARVSALQGQLAGKDQEITSLQNQFNDQRLAREAAETALRGAENQNKSLSEQLQNSQSKKAPASDLK